MDFKSGQLVAVMGVLNREQVRRIARVIEVREKVVVVETDAKLESEAAIEHDFHTPNQERMTVRKERLRPIIEETETDKTVAPSATAPRRLPS